MSSSTTALSAHSPAGAQPAKIEHLPAPRGKGGMTRPDTELPTNDEERAALVAIIEDASQPIREEDLENLCVRFLMCYHPNIKQGASDAIIDRFVRRLRPYPYWAVDAAFDWWDSKDNPDGAFAPKAGRIEAIAEEKMISLRLAQSRLDRYDREKRVKALAPPPVEERKPITLSQFNKMCKEHGIINLESGEFAEGASAMTKGIIGMYKSMKQLIIEREQRERCEGTAEGVKELQDG